MSTTKRTTLRAQGLSCPSCVRKIESALTATHGVSHAEVKFDSGRIVVVHDPSVVRVDGLIAAIAKAGYAAERSGV